MGNTFTIYTGNNQFNINAVTEIYAIAIVGLSSEITYTVDEDWTAAAGTSDSKYNYVFRYQPNGIRTARTKTDPESHVFDLDTGSIPTNTTIHWVNGTTSEYDGDPDSSTPFSAVTYNINYVSTDAGSGSGDPHIIPLYNPTHDIFMLPTNSHIYKYFDNCNSEQRVIVNAKMWVLSNEFIYITEKLNKKKKKCYNTALNKITSFVIKDNYELTDTSFMKYISFIIKTYTNMEYTIIDMETLDIVDSDNINDDVENYCLKKKSNHYCNNVYISEKKPKNIILLC